MTKIKYVLIARGQAVMENSQSEIVQVFDSFLV